MTRDTKDEHFMVTALSFRSRRRRVTKVHVSWYFYVIGQMRECHGHTRGTKVHVSRIITVQTVYIWSHMVSLKEPGLVSRTCVLRGHSYLHSRSISVLHGLWPPKRCQNLANIGLASLVYELWIKHIYKMQTFTTKHRLFSDLKLKCWQMIQQL